MLTTEERRALLAYAAWWRGDLDHPDDAWAVGFHLMPELEPGAQVISSRADIAESLAYDGTNGP